MATGSRTPGFLQAAALLLPITMAVMGSVVLQPVQGLLLEHFADVPRREYWVPFLLTVPAIAATLFTVPAGYLADIFGRRRILLVAMLVYTIAGVAPFLMQNLLPIAVSRVIVGLSEGVVLTVTTAMIGDYFKGHARDRLLGLQAALASTSASLLIPLSGYLGGRIGWNGPFLVYLISLLWFLGILFLTWEPRPDAGAGEAQGTASWRGFPWRAMTTICLITVVGAYFFYTVQFEVPLLLPAFGINDPARIGATMGLISWGMVAGGLAFQFVLKRTLQTLLLGELVVIAVTFLIMGRAGDPTVLIVAAFCNQLGCGALLPTLLTASMRHLPFEHRGRGTGIWQGTLVSGQFIVGMSFPALTALHGGNMARALSTVGVVAAIAAIVALLSVIVDARRQPQE